MNYTTTQIVLWAAVREYKKFGHNKDPRAAPLTVRDEEKLYLDMYNRTVESDE